MNEIALSNNLKQLELEIDHHKKIAGQSIWEIGRRLNHVKENDLTHGKFIDWIQKRGIHQREAQRMMKVAEELPNTTTLSHLGSTALYLIATLPEEERGKEHVTSSGHSKMTDEMTVRELQELKKQLKNKETQLSLKEKRIQSLTQKNEDLEFKVNQKPKTIEKEVVKKVSVKPHDYDGLKSDNQQLSAALKQKQAELDATIERNRFIEEQHKKNLDNRKDDLERKEKLEAMQKELNRLANRKEKLSDQLDTIKELTNLKFEIDKVLEKIAPYYFNHNINAIRQDATLEQAFLETVDSLQKWCDEMYSMLGTQQTIEGEIIND